MLTARVARIADRALGEQFFLRSVDRLAGPIVQAIKKPVMIAVLDEVVKVLETGPPTSVTRRRPCCVPAPSTPTTRSAASSDGRTTRAGEDHDSRGREDGRVGEFLFFWGHSGEGIGSWVLSQWWPAPFTVDDRLFPTSEHWMMWRKAALFGDHAAADAVLAAAGPAEAKAIGRGVHGFDGQVWARERFGIVVDGSVAKFGADPALRDYLLATGDRTLVEASPDDAVWGIGLAADHPDAPHPDRWPGLNLLGQALMAARGELASGLDTVGP